MDRIRRLHGRVRSYAWGSHRALAELCHRPSPTPEPEAELWFGAHPSAPSALWLDDEGVETTPLDAWIARDPAAALGAETARAFRGELPFLLKVLAVERALSIQTHPNAERAARGFERENREGIALDDPRRRYRDPHAKPELVCALSRFEALCGFRPAERVHESLAPLRAPALRAVLDALERGGVATGFRALLELADDDKRAIAAEAARSGARDASPGAELVRRLAADYPGDVGVLAPLWMHHVALAPGEALFLDAGEIHAYLRGVAVELMSSSDNVLRGGLTSKHVDPAELLANLHFETRPPEVLHPAPTSRPGSRRYAAATNAFALEVHDLASGPLAREDGPGTAEIVLCASGGASVRDARAGRALPLPRGAAAWIPACAGAHAIEGAGELFVARAGGEANGA